MKFFQSILWKYCIKIVLKAIYKFSYPTINHKSIKQSSLEKKNSEVQILGLQSPTLYGNCFKLLKNTTLRSVNFKMSFSWLQFLWKNKNENTSHSSKTNSFVKGQLISKWFYEVVTFLQKMNENNSHTSKNEFICSFFGGNRWPHKPFRNQLTFSY